MWSQEITIQRAPEGDFQVVGKNIGGILAAQGVITKNDFQFGLRRTDQFPAKQVLLPTDKDWLDKLDTLQDKITITVVAYIERDGVYVPAEPKRK